MNSKVTADKGPSLAVTGAAFGNVLAQKGNRKGYSFGSTVKGRSSGGAIHGMDSKSSLADGFICGRNQG